MTNSQRFAALVRSFPVMAYAPAGSVRENGVDLLALDAWAAREDHDGREGILPTVQFLLGVWSHYHPWQVGRFDLFRALEAWDTEQLAAFQRWAAAPWRP